MANKDSKNKHTEEYEFLEWTSYGETLTSSDKFALIITSFTAGAKTGQINVNFNVGDLYLEDVAVREFSEIIPMKLVT